MSPLSVIVVALLSGSESLHAQPETSRRRGAPAAPFRKTEAAITDAAARYELAVEMECAGLYAFARVR